jgi:type I restriction-modification system DNA methylase subunit
METLTQRKRNKEEDKISKIIDRVLRQVFGEEALLLIYRYLENKYSVKQNEISEKIDVFTKGLEEFLSSGAYVIEQKILEDIYSSYGLLRRLELERAREECDFVSQVKFLREKYSWV